MGNDITSLVSLCDRAALPLIDVRDEIRKQIRSSEERERVLRNLEAIQRAVQEIPGDMAKVSKGEPPSGLKYDWPRPKSAG